MGQFIKKFSNKLFIKKELNFMVLKRELTFVLPYLSKLSLDFKDEAKANYRRDLPYCKLKVIFKYK